MAVETNAGELSAAAVEALSSSRNEPAWMRDKRRAAWQLSRELPMPSGTDEAWRRTDLRGLDLGQYTAPLPPGEAVARREQLPAYLAPHLAMPETPVGGVLVHQDGTALWQTLESDLAGQGVVFCDLDRAVHQHVPRIADERGACIAHEGERRPGENAGQDLRRAAAFIVLVEGLETGPNAVVGEESSGMPRVLGDDDVDFAEHRPRPLSEIGEVSDGGGDDVERTGAALRRSLPRGVPIPRGGGAH